MLGAKNNSAEGQQLQQQQPTWRGRSEAVVLAPGQALQEDYSALPNNNPASSAIDLDAKESIHDLFAQPSWSALRHDTTPHAPRRHSHPKSDIPLMRRDDCLMYMNTNAHLKKRDVNMNTLFLYNDEEGGSEEGDENGISVSRARRKEGSESSHPFLINKVTSTPHFGGGSHFIGHEETTYKGNWGKNTEEGYQNEKENRSSFFSPERMLLPYQHTSKRTNRVPFSELTNANRKTGRGGCHGKGNEADETDDDHVLLSRDHDVETGNEKSIEIEEENGNDNNHCYLDETIYSISSPVTHEDEEEEENPREADDEFSFGVCIAGAEADRMMRNRAKVVLFNKDGEVENQDEAVEKDKEELCPYPVSATPDWEEKRYDHHGFQEILLRCERYEAMGGTVNMHNMSSTNMNMNMNHMNMSSMNSMTMNFGGEGLPPQHHSPYCGPAATPQGGEEVVSPLEDGVNSGGEHSMHAVSCGENGDDANAHAISSSNNGGGLMSMSVYDQASNQQWQQGMHQQWGTHNGAYDMWLSPGLGNNNVSSQTTTFASNGGLTGLHSTFEGGAIPISPQLSLAAGVGKSTTNASHMGYSSLNSMSTNQNQFYGQGNAPHHQNNMGQNTHGQHQPPTSIHAAGLSGSNGYGGAAMDNMMNGGGSMMNGGVTGGQLDHNMQHGGGALNQGGYYGGSSSGWAEDGNNSGAVYLDLSHALPIDSHNHSHAHNTILQQQMAMACDTGVTNNGNGQLQGICQMPPSPGQMNMATTPTTAPNTPPNHMEGKANWEPKNGENATNTTAGKSPMSPPDKHINNNNYPHENGNRAPTNNLSIMNMLRNPPPPTSPRHHSNERRPQSMNVARSQSMRFTQEHESMRERQGQPFMNVARSQSLLSIGHQQSIHSLTNVVGGSLDSRGPHEGKLEHIDPKGKWEVTSQSDENENWEPPAYDAYGVSSACDGNRMPSGATKGTRGSSTWYNEHSSARGQGQQRHGGLPPPPPPPTASSRGVPPSPHMIPQSWRNGGSRHHNGHHHNSHHREGHHKNYNNHMSHSPFVSTNGMDVGKNSGGHHTNNGAGTAHEKTNCAATMAHNGAPGGREHGSKNGGSGGEPERENMPTAAAPHNGDLLLTGDFLTMAKTQAGSKYLQRSLQERNRSAMDYIFHQVETAAPSLMCDKYANYLCSQVFVASDQRYRRRLLGKILPNIKEIACDKRGTHALQALIQVLGSGLGPSSPEEGGGGGGGDPAGEQLREENWTTRSRRRPMYGEDNNNASTMYEGDDNECEDRWGNASSSSSPRDMTDDYDFIDEQQIKFVKALSKDLAVCAMDPNGTHAVQKTLQCFRMPATDVVLKEILDRFLQLAHNAHGLCVLKVCITCSIDNGSLWSTGRRGAPSTTNVGDRRPTSGPTTAEVSASTNDRTTIKRPRDAILEQLTLHALDLVQSPYGNYAVQHALEEYSKADWMGQSHGRNTRPAHMEDGDSIWNARNTPYENMPYENMRLGEKEAHAHTNTMRYPGVGSTSHEYVSVEEQERTEQCDNRSGSINTPYTGVCAPLLEALVGRYANLSVQKFSSNVVEKILIIGPDAVRRTVIEELGQADRMAVVVSSVYGQYVIKRALKVASPEQTAELQKSISEHLFHVSNRQMRIKWKKMIYSRRDEEEEGDE